MMLPGQRHAYGTDILISTGLCGIILLNIFLVITGQMLTCLTFNKVQRRNGLTAQGLKEVR